MCLQHSLHGVCFSKSGRHSSGRNSHFWPLGYLPYARSYTRQRPEENSSTITQWEAVMRVPPRGNRLSIIEWSRSERVTADPVDIQSEAPRTDGYCLSAQRSSGMRPCCPGKKALSCLMNTATPFV